MTIMKKVLFIIAAAAALLAVACKKEKIDPTKPSITWESNPGFAQAEMTNALDAMVSVAAPGLIQDLKLVLNLGANNNLVNQYIKIESNKSKSGSNPVLDLVGDDSAANLLGGLGMRVGSSLRGRELVTLDLRKILERILLGQPVDNNTLFTIEVKVTDQANNTVSKTAKFHFTAAPTISWAKNPGFDEVDVDAAAIECKVDIWAPGMIEKLTVKLENNAAPFLTTYVTKRTADSKTLLDLVENNLKDDEAFKGYFPRGAAVSGKDRVVLDFSFLYDIKYDMEASTNVFTVTVVDKNGKETVNQVKFVKK